MCDDALGTALQLAHALEVADYRVVIFDFHAQQIRERHAQQCRETLEGVDLDDLAAFELVDRRA